MNNLNTYSIGIDIGGTNTVFGIINTNGKIIYRQQIKTNDYLIIDDFIKAIKESLTPFIQQIGKTNIKGIGIGAPNGNLRTGIIEYAPNLPWEDNLPLQDLFSKFFEMPCRLTNDANAAAMGEMLYGAAKRIKDFIIITLGTGVGSGIVCNGLLIDGFDGYAGELGHTIVIPEGRKHWGTSVEGSLEAYASATGIVITAKEFLSLKNAESSLLHNYDQDELTAQIIYDCACKGDELSMNIFQYTGRILGIAFANFALFSSPEAIILFGGLTKAKDFWLSNAQYHMEISLPPNFRNKTKILLSNVREGDAAILGAASLVVLD